MTCPCQQGPPSLDPGLLGCCPLAPSVPWASLPASTLLVLSFPLTQALSSCPAQVLALSSGSRKASAVGNVVNLVSVDVQRLTESVIYLNGLWLPLFWVVICFVYLWQVCWGRGSGI